MKIEDIEQICREFIPHRDFNYIPDLAKALLKRIETPENIKCLFCGEDDFDLIGLKYHLETYCKVFKETSQL